MYKYEFIKELSIDKCSQCPCVQYYPMEDEYTCGISDIRMVKEDLDYKHFYCPLKEVTPNVKK